MKLRRYNYHTFNGDDAMTIKTIRCPYNSNFYVELDPSQVNKDDPGEGTPAMVYGPQGSSGTLYAAAEYSELICGPHPVQIPANVRNWLENVVMDEAESYLYGEGE